MARIGLKYPVYAKYTESDGTESYSDGKNIGKAVKADLNVNISDIKLYADDEIAEEAHEFIEGDVSLDTSDISDENYGILLGHSVDENTGEIIAKDTDKPIPVGFGFYARKIVGGVDHWRAIWLPKVVFTEPNESLETEGENLAFGTHTLPGKIRKNLEGEWKREKTFDTEAAAIAWINSKAGITAASGSGGSGGSGGAGGGS